MRVVGFFILFFLMFPTVSSAAYTYIKVANTTSGKELKSIKSKLNRLGQNATYRVTQTKYIAYSGPYEDTRSANFALQKLKRYFPYAAIVRTERKPTSFKSSKKAQKSEDTKPFFGNPNIKGFFVSGSLGSGSAPVTITDTVNMKLYLPKDSGMSYDLSGGYYFTNDIFVTAGYLNIDTDDMVFSNFYASVNYKFGPYGKFSPYIGAIVGYSMATWNISPLDNTSKSDSRSDSPFSGTQIGVLYDYDKAISLFTNYQCLFMKHSTLVTQEPEVTKLQHNTLHNIQLGARYSF